MNSILNILPQHIQTSVALMARDKWTNLEEIRLRVNQAVELVFQTGSQRLEGTIMAEQDTLYILNQLSEHSLYRMEKELQEGFITIQGGHRVGLAGKVLMKSKSDVQLQRITFFNIRIAKEVINVALPLLPHLIRKQIYHNTLFIGPPKTGKTTLIRDVARLISNGNTYLDSKRVGIVDERSEIAASIEGIPQHSVGESTDVMDACPKATGMMIMIRSMSPEVLVIDEVGKKADVEAIMEAILSGVTIICTVHGYSFTDILKRPSMRMLFENEVFSRIVVLSSKTESEIQADMLDILGNKITSHRIIK